MFQIDNASAATAAPAKKPTGTPGWFTPGSIGGVNATILEADWLNIVQTEILNVLAAAGIAPDKTNDAQLIAAILALIAAKPNQALPGGAVRLSATLSAAGSAVSFTADYLTLIGPAGGIVLAGFNEPLDVTTVGAGGMDTGAAPASGFLSIYAIYNPTTQSAALLGTTAGQTTTYSGAHMPAGFTASSLIAIWPTNASSQLVSGAVIDRGFYYTNAIAVLSGGAARTATPVSLAAAVPAAARGFYGVFAAAESGSISVDSSANFAAVSTTLGSIVVAASVTGVDLNLAGYLPIVTAQRTYYFVGTATAQAGLEVTGFGI